MTGRRPLPRRDDGVVRIDHREPLPGYREPVGRWMLPYMSLDGTWKCVLRRPLTYAQEKAGLLYMVIASDRDDLAALMNAEDEKAERLTVPASRHRDSG